jgi:hypothetical protein
MCYFLTKVKCLEIRFLFLNLPPFSPTQNHPPAATCTPAFLQASRIIHSSGQCAGAPLLLKEKRLGDEVLLALVMRSY